MVESSDEPSLLDRTRSSPGPAYAASKPFRAGTYRPDLKDDISFITKEHHHGTPATQNDTAPSIETSGGLNVPDNTFAALPPPAPPPPENGLGEKSSTIGSEEKEVKLTIFKRFKTNFNLILLGSWLNVLLVFVPVGIAVDLAGVDKTIVFAMNAIAIVPLAGLLSYATEQIASDLGDTIGALMNVTFGNAVELIIL